MDQSDGAKPSVLRSLPGYLGYTASETGTFIVAIHADWPVYPCPPGGGHALFDLAEFPVGTEFVKEDDIDQCLLFQARNYGETKGRRDKWPFFVAVWHGDLNTLARQGLVSGVQEVSQEMWQYLRHNEIANGTVHPIDSPARPDEDANDEAPGGYAYVDPGVPLVVQDAGWRIVESELAGALSLPDSLLHINKLVEFGLYDTAVREVAVTLESALRNQIGGHSYGQDLVKQFLGKLDNESGPTRSAQSIYRLRLRSFFQFVRNEFAHNRVELTRSRALSIIAHGAMLLNDVTVESRASDE